MISSELQEAVVARLKSHVTLVGGRVYDSPSSQANLPYLTIGESSYTTDDAECMNGRTEVMQIDAWATALPNRALIKNIVDQVVLALHQYRIPEYNNLRTGPFRVLMFRVIGDPDPTILHGLVQFEVFTQYG